VVKALALGANAVMIGRATLYGTAVAGETGAARAIEIYRDEIDRLLALIGCPDISALDAGYLAR
jgi:(S)-mandelate dehydrogenase